MSYPEHMLVRRVEKKGQFWWKGARVFLSEALAHEPIGLEDLDGRYFQIYFADRKLVLFDSKETLIVKGAQAQRTLRKIHKDEIAYRDR